MREAVLWKHSTTAQPQSKGQWQLSQMLACGIHDARLAVSRPRGVASRGVRTRNPPLLAQAANEARLVVLRVLQL